MGKLFFSRATEDVSELTGTLVGLNPGEDWSNETFIMLKLFTFFHFQSTSNYHARKYGVRAAMPGFIAKKLCPSLVIVPLNFDKYRAVSEEVRSKTHTKKQQFPHWTFATFEEVIIFFIFQIREIFAEYDPNFQPMSLDEAYLDFTDHLEQRQSCPESSLTHRYRSRSNTPGMHALHNNTEMIDGCISVNSNITKKIIYFRNPLFFRFKKVKLMFST